MSAFSTLLALINAQIKTNGQKAITGAKLNGVLVQMVNELGSGYQFIDIATPATDPGTPDENVWYIASQAGTYTNFGGIIVNENEVCALVWNGSWTKKVTGAATAAQVNQLGQKAKIVGTNNAGYEIYRPIYGGTSYHIHIDNPDVDMSGVTIIGAYRFLVEAYDDNNVLKRTEVGVSVGNELESDYYFDIPADATKLRFFGRCTIGSNLNFSYSVDYQKIFTELLKKLDITNDTGFASLMIAGGSYFTYNRQTRTFVIPASALIKYGTTGLYKPSAAISIVLQNEAGFLLFNRSNNTFRVQGMEPGSRNANEYILFAYNRVINSEELITTLPKTSIRYSDFSIFEYTVSPETGPWFPSVKKILSPSTPGYTLTPLLLLWFSDIHGNATNLSHIITVKNRYASFIDDIIASGDQITQYYNNPMTWWDGVTGSNKILQAIGNHEVWRANEGEPDASAQMAYDKFIAPYVSNWGVTLAGNGLCYYYKDYQNSNVRIIVLDCMHFDDAQNTWLQNVLSSAKTSGLSVVCVTHYIPDEPTFIDNPFTGLWFDEQGVLNSAACASVQEFIDGGGKFITWLCGHYHSDYLFTCANYPQQFGIAVGTANSANSGEMNNYRDGYTNYDLFNAIAFDVNFHVIKILRLGTAIDMYGRHKRSVTIDYVNRKVIGTY